MVSGGSGPVSYASIASLYLWRIADGKKKSLRKEV
jgi:hypothetical protein